jgi:hypothetical protein
MTISIPQQSHAADNEKHCEDKGPRAMGEHERHGGPHGCHGVACSSTFAVMVPGPPVCSLTNWCPNND